MKIQFVVISLLLLLNTTHVVSAQGLALPDDGVIRSAITIGGYSPDDPVITDEDVAPAPSGKINGKTAKWLAHCAPIIRSELAKAPEGPTGKQSAWYARWQSWAADLDRAAATRRQTDALMLIPTLADWMARSDQNGAVGSFPDLDFGPGSFVHTVCSELHDVIAAYTIEQNASVDPAILTYFVRVISTFGMIEEPDLEDWWPPVDAAGILIMEPVAVVNQLKSLPLSQARRFLTFLDLTPDRSSNRIGLSEYESDGRGLMVLKARYAQNKGLVYDQYRILQTYVAGGGMSPPTFTAFTPASGYHGTPVTLTGTNFTGATAVRFGEVNAASYTVQSPTQIRAYPPAVSTPVGGDQTHGGGGSPGGSGTAVVTQPYSAPLTVTTPAGSVTSQSDFSVLAPPFEPPNPTE